MVVVGLRVLVVVELVVVVELMPLVALDDAVVRDVVAEEVDEVKDVILDATVVAVAVVLARELEDCTLAMLLVEELGVFDVKLL